MLDSIPVLGTAIVNNPYWLHRLFMSIDYPVDNFVVFNNNGRGQITDAVESVRKLSNPFVKQVLCNAHARERRMLGSLEFNN
jgi:hypothetical protein